MTGTVGEQNSLDHVYSFNETRCSFPKAALLTEFEMTNGQIKLKRKSVINEHLEGKVKDINR